VYDKWGRKGAVKAAGDGMKMAGQKIQKGVPYTA